MADLRPGRGRDAFLPAAGARLAFPPLHHAEDPRMHNPILQHPLLEDAALPIPRLDTEVIHVPDHLLPTVDEGDTDTLPMEQHPSYPFGNPFFIHHAPHTLQPAGSSQPKLDPRTQAKLARHTASDRGRAEAMAYVATGSASARAAVEETWLNATRTPDDAPGVCAFTMQPDGKALLAPHLQLQMQVGAVPQPPTWPFRRIGPGASARPYAALLRTGADDLLPERAVWSDLALEMLAPHARPDSYTLPASLQHPYARDAHAPHHPRRARPSDIPAALGTDTAERDEAWLDGPYAVEPDTPTHIHAATERDPERLFSPALRALDTSSTQEHREFCDTLLSVYARKERRAQTHSPPPPAADDWVWGRSTAEPRAESAQTTRFS